MAQQATAMSYFAGCLVRSERLGAAESANHFIGGEPLGADEAPREDRKSTRLNSSHTVSSYAVHRYLHSSYTTLFRSTPTENDSVRRFRSRARARRFSSWRSKPQQ